MISVARRKKTTATTTRNIVEPFLLFIIEIEKMDADVMRLKQGNFLAETKRNKRKKNWATTEEWMARALKPFAPNKSARLSNKQKSL